MDRLETQVTVRIHWERDFLILRWNAIFDPEKQTRCPRKQNVLLSYVEPACKHLKICFFFRL